MRAIARRLKRLEERFGTAEESWETRQLRRRLEAADRRCGLPPISAERLAELRGKSGSGATTLLLSHLSADHTVFAADQGSGSISNVRRSSLLRSSVVTFVEGATQRTLPQYKFTEPLQLVLIDGPHAYPFPDLEYYFLYPPLETGALLVVDDIHIRSVHNFFEFLRHDAMFELEEVAHTTAFFTRTQAPVFDPLGDSWWTQRYNAKPLLRYTWKERFKTSIPDAVFERLSRFRRRTKAGECAIEIHSPRENEVVGEAGVAEGSASLTPGAHLWILVRRNSPFAHALRSCRSFLGIHFEVDQGYDWSQTGNSVIRPLSAGGVE